MPSTNTIQPKRNYLGQRLPAPASGDGEAPPSSWSWVWFLIGALMAL
jgi:hypothetical protein